MKFKHGVLRGVVTRLLLILLLCPVSLCASETKPEKADPKNELNIGCLSSPSTMDPQLVLDAPSAYYASYIYGCLYRLDENNQPMPELAEKYDLSEDGLTYTFHLKDGIRYSNGEPIKAGDFVYSFRRTADPATASRAVYFFQSLCKIRNIDKVTKGELSVEELGVSAPDDQTFVVELEKPCPFFLFLMSSIVASPCNEDFLGDCEAPYASSPETMLSSGPFIVDRYEPMGMQIHFKKNPDYVNADQVSLSGVMIRKIETQQQAVMAYQAGEIDIAPIGGEFVELSRDDPNMKSRSGSNIRYLACNVRKSKTMQNKNIRQAIAKSIDRESIVKNYFHGNAQALTRIIPKMFATEPNGKDFGEEEDLFTDVVGYDPDAASELWQKGLEELGEKEVTIELMGYGENTKLYEILKDQCEKNLPGLTLEVQLESQSQYLVKLMSGDYEFALSGWSPDYPDPQAYLGILYSTSEENTDGYTNKDFDSLLDQGGKEKDPQKRMDLLHQAEKIAVEDIAFIPFVADYNSWLISGKVSGAYIGTENCPVCTFAKIG